MATVLIVDDEKSIRITLGEFLRLDGHTVQTAEDAEAAKRLLGKEAFDVVITDIILPRVSGVTLLQHVREQSPDIQVIMMTGEPTVETAVEAVRAGAYDYLSKPVGKRDLLAVVAQAARLKALFDEKRLLEEENLRYRVNLERMVEERTKALKSRTRQLEAVREVSAEISREMNLRTVLSLIVERAMDLVSGISATVFLWEEETQCLVPKAWHGYDEWRGTVRLHRGEGVAGSVAARREGLILEDYRTSPYVLPSIDAHAKVGAVLAEPLLYRDHLLGVIIVDHVVGGRRFSAEDQGILMIFAAQATIAIENARLYDEVVRYAAELEKRVHERTRDLEAANGALAAASRHKSEFLANMSHELRTPLNSILGFSQLLLEHNPNLTPERHTRYLTHIHSSGTHLLALINDILDLSKVEAGKFVLRPEPIAVGQVLEDLLVIGRGLAHKKQQQMKLSVEPALPPLVADPVRFKQIVFNLLSNAVKFTPEGGHISVRVRALMAQAEAGGGRERSSHPPVGAATPERRMELSVADTGIGIRPEDIPKLFQEFMQLETAKQITQEGTGLGLALTKRLVELHGGTIRVESAGEGLGSTFTIRMPFSVGESGRS
jgi:signal transduction histidine kinase/DNA-binding response OmpR family regulator